LVAACAIGVAGLLWVSPLLLVFVFECAVHHPTPKRLETT